MGLAEVIVGLLVLVGTPLLTFLGVRHTNKTTLKAATTAANANVTSAIEASSAQLAAAIEAANAQVAAAVEAANAQIAASAQAADAARDTASIAAGAQAQSEFLGHFHWACELVASGDADKRGVGIGVLQSMLEDEEIHPTHLQAAAGVLQWATASAVDRLGDGVAGNVAELPPVGEGGDSA